MKQTVQKVGRPPRPTVQDLLAERRAVSGASQLLNEEQLKFLAEVLANNDATDVTQLKLSIQSVHAFMKNHLGLRMGQKSLARAACRQLNRASWGQPGPRSA